MELLPKSLYLVQRALLVCLLGDSAVVYLHLQLLALYPQLLCLLRNGRRLIFLVIFFFKLYCELCVFACKLTDVSPIQRSAD